MLASAGAADKASSEEKSSAEMIFFTRMPPFWGHVNCAAPGTGRLFPYNWLSGGYIPAGVGYIIFISSSCYKISY